jgi:glutathione S-transferase
MSIRVYGFWRSIASFRVRVALRLKGLPFEETSIDILSGEQFKLGYDAVNPEHVVPTLIHDGHSLFQSMAIIEYLDDIKPTPRLLPEDARDRAYARSLALIRLPTPIRSSCRASATISQRHSAPMPRRSRTGASIGRPRDFRRTKDCSRGAYRRRLRSVRSQALPISASPARSWVRIFSKSNWIHFQSSQLSPNAASG